MQFARALGRGVHPHAYSNLARTEVASNEDREQFVRLAETLGEPGGVEAIVLAGTDLAVMFGPENTPFPHVDCTRVHIDAIMAASTG